MLAKELEKVPLTARLWTAYSWFMLVLLGLVIVDRLAGSQLYYIIVRPLSILMAVGIAVELAFIIPFLMSPKKYLVRIKKAMLWLKYGVLLSIPGILVSWVLIIYTFFDADPTWRTTVLAVSIIFSPAIGAVSLGLGTAAGLITQMIRR